MVAPIFGGSEEAPCTDGTQGMPSAAATAAAAMAGAAAVGGSGAGAAAVETAVEAAYVEANCALADATDCSVAMVAVTELSQCWRMNHA